MNSTTVRVSKRTQQILKELAAHQKTSIQSVLEQAVETYRRQQFFAALDEAYAAMWADPVAAQTEEEERRLLDRTLMDGLDPNEIWHADGRVEYRPPQGTGDG
jgi:predicted transcriptional regulator